MSWPSLTGWAESDALRDSAAIQVGRVGGAHWLPVSSSFAYWISYCANGYSDTHFNIRTALVYSKIAACIIIKFFMEMF